MVRRKFTLYIWEGGLEKSMNIIAYRMCHKFCYPTKFGHHILDTKYQPKWNKDFFLHLTVLSYNIFTEILAIFKILFVIISVHNLINDIINTTLIFPMHFQYCEMSKMTIIIDTYRQYYCRNDSILNSWNIRVFFRILTERENI